MNYCAQIINMDHQQHAGSPACAFLHGQLSMVLAGVQQLPHGWQHQEEFTSLLQRALNMLSDASTATIPAVTDAAADARDNKSAKQRQLSSDQDKPKQPHQKQHQQDVCASLDTTAADDYTAAAAGIEAQVDVLGSASSSTAARHSTT
jgi:hypothetical protein